MNLEEILSFCLGLDGVYLDYPFAHNPIDHAWPMVRHRANGRVFAQIYEREGKLWVNVKCEPALCDLLRSSLQGVRPAHHMNKVHWNMIQAQGSDVTAEKLCEMLIHSYNLTR